MIKSIKRSVLYNTRNPDPDFKDRPWGWVDYYKSVVVHIAYEEDPYLWDEGWAMADMIEWLREENAPAHVFEELKFFDMVEVEITITDRV